MQSSLYVVLGGHGDCQSGDDGGDDRDDGRYIEADYSWGYVVLSVVL